MFVSPLGDDETNDGLTYDTPLKTIYKATIDFIDGLSNEQYILMRVYSHLLMVRFPLVPDYITIKGYSINETILDAEQTSNVTS